MVKTFARGGVHPHDNKKWSRHVSVQNAGIPNTVVIPMSQHMGKPADLLVQADDVLTEGMLIGKAAGFFSVNVHSSVAGKVREITEIYLANGMKSQAVVVEVEEGFDPEASSMFLAKENWRTMSDEDIVNRIADMGVAGLGGATFPTHIKYAIKDRNVEYLVVNGVECEPFLTADHRLMLEKSDCIIEGIEISRKVLNADNVIIGIEANKPDAIQSLRDSIIRKNLDFEVVALKTRYPQGDEKQLLKATINREVPSGALPLDIGAVVSNVGTLYAIYEAVVLKKPVIERIVTVSGSILKNPGNFKVRLGTSIRELVDACGGFTEEPVKMIAGGPMMGFSIFDLNAPVTKGVSGILALSERDLKPAGETACISCGRCIHACPMGLSPTTLFKLIDHQDYEKAKQENLLDCKECGCCGFTCPARLPLVQMLRLGKLMLRKKA